MKSKKDKIILVYPKIGTELKGSGGAIGLPYSLLTISSELVDKYEVIIIDQRTNSKWKEKLKNNISKCLCVGISSMTGAQLKNALKISKIVRKLDPNIKIIWGGVHVSIMPKQALENKYIDIIVKGEGEKTFPELVNAIKKNEDLDKIKGICFIKNKKKINNPNRPLIDLNELKPIPWHLINIEKYLMKRQLTKNTKRELDLGEFSRGCPYRCTFCYNSTKTQFTWRSMSPEKVVKVIKEAIDKFYIDGFWIRDDNFFVSFKYVEKVLKLMKDEGIKIPWYCPGLRIDTVNKFPEDLMDKLIKSNIKRFRIGVESGNERVLKLINKGIKPQEIINANLKLKKYKIPVEYSYIIGFPTETIKEMYDTVDLVIKMKKDNPYSVSHNINIYSPYPGTELYETSLKMGLKEPKTITEWSECHHLNMNYSNYSKKQKNIMKSISELSYYTAGFVYENFPLYLKILSLPLRWWCEFRFRFKIFKLRIDLEMVKKVRKIFLGI
jgi:radical SAM superfamily enzyme YgiQ (UPF0313 family)